MFLRRLFTRYFTLLIFIAVSSSVSFGQDVIISPSPLIMGKIPIGSSSEREIIIFNTTVNQVSVNSISITGEDSSLFTIVDNPGSTNLGPIEKEEILIKYTPNNAERNTAIFRIETSVGTYTDSLIGYGIPITNGIQAFERILGTTEGDGAGNLRQLSDGGFIISGSTTPKGEDYSSFYLVKTDAYGKLVWTTTYGDEDGVDSGSDVEQTNDGGFLFLGTTENWGNGGTNMMLLKFNSAGEYQWRKTYGGGNDDAGTAILKADDGAYVLVGQTVPSGGIGKSIYVVKVSSDGTVQWENDFGGVNGADGSSIVQLNDGSFVLAGYTTIGDDFQIYLVKIDNSGNLIWEKNYGGADYDVGYAINTTSDGNLIVGGYTANKGAGARDGYILKLSTDGNLIWDKAYGFQNSDEFRGIVEAPDGSIIAVGNSITRVTQNEQFASAYIVKTSSDGSEIWSQIYGGSLNDGFGEVIIANDGGYVCIGGTSSFSKSGDIYFVKTGSSGIISDVEIDNEIALPFSIELKQNYPNPFNPSTTIQFTLPDINGLGKTNIILKIFDILGTELMTLINEEKAPGSYQIDFNGKYLSSGIYFYQLISDQIQITKKMMLIK